MIVIGNGESRTYFNLNAVKDIKIGCNAAHRDLNIDHLICVDKRMVKEALTNNFINSIYTRPEWFFGFASHLNVKKLPRLPYKGTYRQDDPWHWGSGPYAVLMGAILSTDIKLVGFDLYSENNCINNVYKDTKNYENSKYKAIDPTYWIYQISKIFTCYPNHSFTIYQKDNWVIPNSWKKNNVMVDKLSNFS